MGGRRAEYGEDGRRMVRVVYGVVSGVLGSVEGKGTWLSSLGGFVMDERLEVSRCFQWPGSRAVAE